VKISTTALSERFERELVADSFNQHDRTQVDACGPPVCCRNQWSTWTVSRSLLLVHTSYLHSSHAAPRTRASLEIGSAAPSHDLRCARR